MRLSPKHAGIAEWGRVYSPTLAARAVRQWARTPHLVTAGLKLSQDLRGLTVSTVGKRLENLSMEDLEDFTPRAETVPVQAKTNEWSEVSSNGTSTTSSTIAATKDLLGAEAFSPMKEEDPMCMVRALMKSQLNDVEANTLRRLVDEVMDALGPERVGEEWEPSDWFDD
ncbi:uncharacterized protein LOC142583061 isoform X1 [Dermacentor variabilis]|uniref:uncharacterized protein LOC142583061 isoform X1 n=1 Tax=Dermacentor variabilis TaxID=34621 RepID=UPI003F5B2415